MNHFKCSVGAPLYGTEAFPTRQSQVQRFAEQGWPVVECPTLDFVYRDTLSAEEKVWLETVEPFDEFEEWHLMCSHYILLTAFKGSCQSLREDLFNGRKGAPLEKEFHECSQCEIHTLDVLSSQDRLKRFGHTATSFPDGRVVLIGGFGVENGKHMRLAGVQLLQSLQDAWHCTEMTADSEMTLGCRVFHTATALSNNGVLIFGGRTSPTKPCTETILLTLTDNSGSAISVEQSSETESKEFQSGCKGTQTYKATGLKCQGELPAPRWRHSATRIVLPSGAESVLIFGGRTPTCLALGDCYLLDVKSNTWSQVFLNGDTAEPRHSHTACAWKHHVVLAGGLGRNLDALNTVQIIDTLVNPMTLRTLPVDPPLQPRYSHTAHVVNDQLILVGGVTPNSSHPPGVVILHLGSFIWKSFTLPAYTAPSVPLMLHNHCSVSLDESQGVMVLGGGGNCFSFGTHLNDGLVVIDIPAV